MSRYLFIATNYEIPELDNTNKKIITVKEAIESGVKSDYYEEMDPDDKLIIYENEEDFDELVIT
ncbi:hypothetical protein CN601_21575, partial [Bacillus sp. AFS017336]